MNILWAALAISLIVSVVFYALAASWGRTLRGHSRAIRLLYQRLEAIESLEDPFLRRRVNELAPSQLEEVCIFSLNLSERFWRNSLGATEGRARDIRESGTILGSVKFEIWRSHITISVTELLPASKLAGWQNRVINIYASESHQPTTLWELHLGHDSGLASGGRLLQLYFRSRCIELVLRGSDTDSTAADQDATAGGRTVLRIPLDSEQLSEHRVENEEWGDSLPDETPESNVLRFSNEDENLGIDWRLSIRTLDGGRLSNRWKTLEPAQVRRVS